MASSRVELLRRQLREAEEAAARELETKFSKHGTSNSFNNHGTSNSFNNQGGGGQNFSNAEINSGSNSADRDRYDDEDFYNGMINSGANSGNRNRYRDEDFYNGMINSGANSADRNRYRTNYGERTINNGGTFNGHGNGGFIDGDFHAPTTNYNY